MKELRYMRMIMIISYLLAEFHLHQNIRKKDDQAILRKKDA